MPIFFFFFFGTALKSFFFKKIFFFFKFIFGFLLKKKKRKKFFSVWALSGDLIKKMNEKTSLLIDGFPRNLTEAEIIDEAIAFYGLKNVHPVFIETSKEDSRKRLLDRGRADDTEIAIKRRLDYFDQYVQPVIDYYEKESKYKLTRINGEQSVEDVHREILEKVFK